MEVKLNSGALFANTYKEKEGQPDYRGEFIDATGKKWELAGWKNTSQKGTTYLKLKAQEPRKKEEASQPTQQAQVEPNDDIPF
jgi:uncharacterized protein (DUF736 family)